MGSESFKEKQVNGEPFKSTTGYDVAYKLNLVTALIMVTLAAVTFNLYLTSRLDTIGDIDEDDLSSFSHHHGVKDPYSHKPRVWIHGEKVSYPFQT